MADPRLPSVITCITAYAVIVMLIDPYLWIEDRADDVLMVAFVLPPLLWLRPVVRSGAWLAVCGIVFFSAASIACLLFNGTARGWGVGFSGWWVH